MSQGEEQTFSVEVLSFASDAEDESLVASIQDAFGIECEAAKTLIQQAPVRVKRGADPDGTKILVSQLLSLKADVRITNEQTGEERTYQATALEGAAPSRPPPPGPSAATKSPLPAGQSPIAGIGPMEGFRPEAGSSLLEALKLARERKNLAAAGMLPDDPRPTPHPLAGSGVRAHPLSGTGSGLKVPPSSPPPAMDGPVLESCTICNRKVAQGDICNHCGWSNSLRKRLSPSGKEAIPEPKVGTPIVAALVAVGLAGAVAGFWFLGPFETFAAPAFAMAIGLVVTGTTIQLRSGKWSVPPTYFKPEEKKAVTRSKVKWFFFAVCFLLIGGAMFVPSATEPRAELRVDSFGIGWAAALPVQTPEPLRKAFKADALGENVAVTGMVGRPDRGDPHGYVMLRVPLGMAGKANVNSEGLDKIVKSVLGNVYTEVELAEPKAASFDKSSLGRSGTFKAKDDGRVAAGEWRAFLFGAEILLVAYASEGGPGDARGQQFLDGLRLVTPGAP